MKQDPDFHIIFPTTCSSIPKAKPAEIVSNKVFQI